MVTIEVGNKNYNFTFDVNSIDEFIEYMDCSFDSESPIGNGAPATYVKATRNYSAVGGWEVEFGDTYDVIAE